MLAKELDHRLVAPDVLGLDALIGQVGAGSHPAVVLVGKRLNVVRHRQGLLKSLNIGGRLVPRGENGDGHLDTDSILGVDHGRVALGSGREWVCIAGRDDGDNLAAPAELNNGGRKAGVNIYDTRQTRTILNISLTPTTAQDLTAGNFSPAALT